MGCGFARQSIKSNYSSSTSLIGDTILNVFQVLPPTVWKEIVPLLGTISTASLVTGILVFLFDRHKESRNSCLAGLALLMAVIFAISASWNAGC